jgi:hypothetical protein
MTKEHQPPSQKFEKDKSDGGQEDLNNVSSSSSSSSSRPSITPYRFLMQCKKETGLKNQAEFFCPAITKEKDRVAKKEALVAKSNNDMKKMSKTYTELIVESGSFNEFLKNLKKDNNTENL